MVVDILEEFWNFIKKTTAIKGLLFVLLLGPIPDKW